MTRRLAFLLLAVLVLAVPAFAKRRAVTPGNPDHCVTMRLGRGVYTQLIETDGEYVYWLDELATLNRVPLLGGTKKELAQFDEDLFVLTMLVDDTHVYLSALPPEAILSPRPGMIFSVPKTGGVPGVFVNGVATAFELEDDDTHLYWAAAGTFSFLSGSVQNDGKIERIRKDGANRQALANGVSAPLGLALEGDLVWFGQTGLATGNDTIGLYTVPKSGGTVQTINDDAAVAEIALTPTSIVAYGGTDESDNAVFTISRDGSTVRTLVDDEAIGGGIRAVDGRVYYVTERDDGNALWWVAESGGSPTLVRDDLYFTTDVVIDGCTVIVGTYGGQLLRTTR